MSEMGLKNICTRCLSLVVLISERCWLSSWQSARKSSEGLHLKGKYFCKSVVGQNLQKVLKQEGERAVQVRLRSTLFKCLTLWIQVVPLT